MRQNTHEQFQKSLNNHLQNKPLFFWKLSSRQCRSQHNKVIIFWNVAHTQIISCQNIHLIKKGSLQRSQIFMQWDSGVLILTVVQRSSSHCNTQQFLKAIYTSEFHFVQLLFWNLRCFYEVGFGFLLFLVTSTKGSFSLLRYG